MLRRVVEDYLESIKELQFFLPFSALLLLKGYYDIHIIHGTVEFGKDIIAKKDEDGAQVQYVFQLKVGDINLPKYKNDIQPQLLEAAINNLAHPNFNNQLRKEIYFVTTGTIHSPATLAFQEFNNTLSKKYNLAPILTIEKLELVDDFVKYGLEPFFSLHDDPGFIGGFFDIYAKIKNNRTLDSFRIEEYTRRWLEGDYSDHINRLQVLLEAYLFSSLLYQSKRYYQSVLFISALARFLTKNNVYSEHEKILIQFLNDVVTSVIEDVLNFYGTGKNLAEHAATTGLLAIFKYPKLCLHILEIISLAKLLSNKPTPKLTSIVEEIIVRERGWEKPLSDNYAISIALIGLSLIKTTENDLLKKLINNITIWLCDRYGDIGLASLGASEEEEYEQLLSGYLEGLNYKKTNTSLVATVLLDLAYLTNDAVFYESIANELRASSIILQRYHVLNDADIYGYDRISDSFDADFSRTYVADYSKGIVIERERNHISVKTSSQFFLMFLLRDRMFPTFVLDMLQNE